MKRTWLPLFGLLGLVAGCPEPIPPAAAVLEGTWSVTPEDPGDFAGFTYEAVFDANGRLVELSADGPDGAMATLDIDDSETVLEGSDVTITVTRPAGASVFEGTLTEDENTMTGSLTQEIDLENLDILLPGGSVTLVRNAPEQ